LLQRKYNHVEILGFPSKISAFTHQRVSPDTKPFPIHTFSTQLLVEKKNRQKKGGGRKGKKDTEET
jgi:hypothetical protein